MLSLLLTVTLAIGMSSCSTREPQTVGVTRVVPQTVEVTRVVPQTVEVTRIVSQTVVETKIVQMAVTATPEPTPTLALQKWTSDKVIDAFKAAGLEAEGARAMTKDDYGIAPMLAIEGTRFFIPSLCDDCGGRVLRFASQEGLETTEEFYTEMGKASAALFSWTFTKDNILVQINGDLPEERARKYEEVLKKVEE